MFISRKQNLSVTLLLMMALLAWCVPVSATGMPSLTPVGKIEQGLELPGKLDVDGYGNLYVSDLRAGAVNKYGRNGKLISRVGSMKASGRGMAVRPDGQVLYVALAAPKGAVGVFGGDGSLYGYLGKGEGEFGVVSGVSIDAGGMVYVADSGSCLVRVYGPDGRFIRSFGQDESRRLGMPFASINSMGLNPRTGEIYVASNSFTPETPAGVRVYDPSGKLLKFIPNTEAYAGQAARGFGESVMGRFAGICFDQKGRVFYLDSFHSNIRVLTEDGIWVGSHIPAYGDGVGMLTTPFGGVFDPVSGRLYVASGGKGVQVYAVDGGTDVSGSNLAPSVPLPISPVAGSRTDRHLRLAAANARDLDGDALVYDFVLYQEGRQILFVQSVPQGAAGSTELVQSLVLDENLVYQWQVRAFDGKEFSAWSEMQSFVVNAVNEAPTAPVALSPLSGEKLLKSGTLNWSASLDPDPSDSLTYSVQIAEDAGFSILVGNASTSEVSTEIGKISGYDKLQAGREYFWRVWASDSGGLASAYSQTGKFIFDSTILRIHANMPGSRVYLGGNLGYAGQYAGVAPVELRDMVPGVYSLVVERSGFEPWVAQVQIGEGQSSDVYAELAPAYVTGSFVRQPISLLEPLSGDAQPFLVDYDRDGTLDLLAGEDSGALILYRGMVDAQGRMIFQQGRDLGVILPIGSSPFVVDWNNDGKIDILVGAGDGSLTLLRNSGVSGAPQYRTEPLPMTDGSYVAAASEAVPAVVDFDGDGDKDLVLGSGAAQVLLFRNVGSDAGPQFSGGEVLVAKTEKNPAPFFADWDGDGTRDFLVSEGGAVYKYLRQADGRWEKGPLVSAVDSASAPHQALALGDDLRVFVAEVDGVSGKDLFAGNSAGDMVLLHAQATVPVEALKGALVEKAAQVSELAAQAGRMLPAGFDGLVAALRSGEYAKAASLTSALVVGSGTDLEVAVGELRRLLEQISRRP